MPEYIVHEHPDYPYEEPKPQQLIRCNDCEHNTYCCRLTHRTSDSFCSEAKMKRMSDKIALNEESNEFRDIQKEWYEQAAKVKNLEELIQFVDHILGDYYHDYGTMVRAISAMIQATAWMGANSLGITGFQAGCVMWDFIHHWMYSDNKAGLKLLNYDNMLYPQYKHIFEKTISKDVWEELQKEASRKLETNDYAHERVIEHWRSIVNGIVPFGYEVKDE